MASSPRCGASERAAAPVACALTSTSTASAPRAAAASVEAAAGTAGSSPPAPASTIPSRLIASTCSAATSTSVTSCPLRDEQRPVHGADGARADDGDPHRRARPPGPRSKTVAPARSRSSCLMTFSVGVFGSASSTCR